jgi:CDP-glycerol glycerophosphotransferase (TagB/SpsB family)
LKKRYFALFYVSYPYYFPHFIPIANELIKRGHKIHFILSNKQNNNLMQKIAKKHNFDYSFSQEQLFKIKSKFIFFANPYDRAKELKATTIFLEHGIGTKSVGFYHIIEYIDIYLVEGSYKYDRLKELYPHFENKLKIVGFSKLDPIANLDTTTKEKLYKRYDLDKNRKTILYAPTFFPSSIEKMSANFPDDFKECNILIKAHYLTYERKQYKNQRDKLRYWSSFENCTIVDVSEYNLVPFFAISDVMISDESSAMFEFASLNKPVISNRYHKLRLSYYFMPWKLKKRIDTKKNRYRQMLANANNYKDTLRLTKEALKYPDKLKDMRMKLSHEICGTIDGKVSSRIVDILEDYHE